MNSNTVTKSSGSLSLILQSKQLINVIFYDNFICNLVPQPSVTIPGLLAVPVGSITGIQCTITLQQYSSYSSMPITFIVELLKGSTTVSTNYILGAGKVRATAFILQNVGVSTAGQYQCRATVTTTHNNVIDSTPGVSNHATLTVHSKSLVLVIANSFLIPVSSPTAISESLQCLCCLCWFHCQPTLYYNITAVLQLLINTYYCHCGATQGKYNSND